MEGGTEKHFSLNHAAAQQARNAISYQYQFVDEALAVFVFLRGLPNSTKQLRLIE